MRLTKERVVLFVCVENACRSLMAEAFFNASAPSGWTAKSAGTEPASTPNPRTARMLGEVGVDVMGLAPKMLTPDAAKRATIVVTMGCLDRQSCPAFLLATRPLDWELPDPSSLDDTGFRRVRDEIGRRVGQLISSLPSTVPENA